MQATTTTAASQPIAIPVIPAFDHRYDLSAEFPGVFKSSCPPLVVSRFSSWSDDEDDLSDSDDCTNAEDDEPICDNFSAPQGQDGVHGAADKLFKLDLARSEAETKPSSPTSPGVLNLPRIRMSAEVAAQHPTLFRPSLELELSLQHEQTRFERALSFAGVRPNRGSWDGATGSLRQLLNVVDQTSPSAEVTVGSAAGHDQ